MPTTIFQPTSPTNQNRPKVKFSNLRVFCPIWIKFGIWANDGPRITWYKFEMATATFYASTHQQKPRTFRRGLLFFSDFFCSGLIIIIIHMENRMTKPKIFLTSGFSYQDIVAQRSSCKTSYFYCKSCSYEDAFKISIKS